jgi:Transposase IS116/IS110/IS902 family
MADQPNIVLAHGAWRQSGEVDRRGARSKHGPPYLCWALIQAAHNAIRSHPPDRARSERTRARLGHKPGRRDRGHHRRPLAGGGDLVDAHPPAALCSGRRPDPLDRPTVLK